MCQAHRGFVIEILLTDSWKFSFLSKGAIEVSVATMAKVDRLQTDEVYTVGFVPSYDLPDGRPNSIDPFLEPLVKDIETGYIEGRLNLAI